MKSKVRKLLIDYCELLMGRGGTMANGRRSGRGRVSCCGEQSRALSVVPARDVRASTASISDNCDTITGIGIGLDCSDIGHFGDGKMSDQVLQGEVNGLAVIAITLDALGIANGGGGVVT